MTDRQTGREDAERTYDEADRDVVSRKANVDLVPPDGVHIVVLGGACTANHGEGVLGGGNEYASALRHASHAVEGTHAVELFVGEPSRDRDLDDRVQREGVHAPGQQERLHRQIVAQGSAGGREYWAGRRMGR